MQSHYESNLLIFYLNFTVLKSEEKLIRDKRLRHNDIDFIYNTFELFESVISLLIIILHNLIMTAKFYSFYSLFLK